MPTDELTIQGHKERIERRISIPSLTLVDADTPTTLLLRREDWAVVNVLTARGAIGDFYKGDILGVDRNFLFYSPDHLDVGTPELWENTPHLMTCRRAWPVPTIAVTNYSYFQRPEKKGKRWPKTSVKNLVLVYGPVCRICGHEFPIRQLTREHVIPQCRGGGQGWDNVVPACAPCNNRKGDKLNFLTWENKPLTVDPKAVERLLRAEIHIPDHQRRPEWIDIIVKARYARYAPLK